MAQSLVHQSARSNYLEVLLYLPTGFDHRAEEEFSRKLIAFGVAGPHLDTRCINFPLVYFNVIRRRVPQELWWMGANLKCAEDSEALTRSRMVGQQQCLQLV